MSMRIGINGFGRIGRLVLRAGLNKPELEFVCVNDLTSSATLAHLFKYDSTFGAFPGKVSAEEGEIAIDGRKIRVVAEKDPAKLPWREMGVDLVIESTGRFTEAEKARAHLEAGARLVLISAPAKGADATIVLGVNEDAFDPAKHTIVSNASCTTNCLAPMAKVLLDNFGVRAGYMTTVHSYTNDQVLLDFPHKDLRRARAAAASMIPSTTGAAKAIGLVIPELTGKLSGISVRVPTQDVSLTDLAIVTEKPVAAEAVNAAFKKASQGRLKGILEYCDVPLVSRDFLGNPASCIFDSLLTATSGDHLVKVFGWYDNEWGYSRRVVDVAAYLGARIKAPAGLSRK